MPPKRKAASKTKATTIKKEAPAVQPKATTEDVDYSKLTVSKLKDECTARSLETTGKKAELVKRLQQDDSNNGGEPSAKIKKEDTDEKPPQVELTMKEKLKAMAEQEKKNKKKSFQIDSLCPRYGSGGVYDDYDCMLNQTNIGANNNKFYIIQLIQDGGRYFVWTRWGRVGESGQNAQKGPFGDLDKAISEFKKKFKDKTRNNWDDRDNFEPASGKYTMIEMDAQDDTDNAELEEKLAQLDSVDGSPVKSKASKKVKACVLDKPTQGLIKLLFDNDMFKEAMAKMDLDVKKMPLGKISKSQIAKGFEVLEEMEGAIKSNNKKTLQDLTSRFYTLIPHNFGRQRPPTIASEEVLRKKMDMLLVLGDIEIAQSLQKVNVKQEDDDGEVDHPYDINYGLLNCGLKHVEQKSKIHNIISTYVENTKSSSSLKLIDVWEVERGDEDKRFAVHDDLDNRKLLWHGTNVAVVVAILKSGLRIMPHSGGRVGRGIYFASEQAKSHCYVGTSNDGTGIMFLNEVALGTEKIIHRDDSSLRVAPAGFDSVLAQGRQEPDPSKDTTITLDKKEVVVPQGKPKPTKSANGSSFHNSEYLVYKESQNRIRYLLKFKFH